MSNIDSDPVDLTLRHIEMADTVLLDALTDEIAVIDSSGRIVGVNAAWVRFAQENGAPDLVKTDAGQNYLEACRRLAATGQRDAALALSGIEDVLRGASSEFRFQYRWDSPSQVRWFDMTVTPLVQTAGAVITHREITALKRAQDVLNLVGEIVPAPTLSNLTLASLVKNLAEILHVRHAFVSECVDPGGTKLRLLAHWAGTGYGELFEYEAAGTPCERVPAEKVCVIPSGVQQLFPEDTWLQTIDAESYLAVGFIDSQGTHLGHLGVIDTRPLHDAPFIEATLRIFAARATRELERLHVRRRLAHLERLLENVADAIIGTDENLVITDWNRAAERTYGWRADEAIGRTTKEVLQTEYTNSERAEALRTIIEAGGFRGEVIQHRKDGTPVDIEALTIAFRDEGGDVEGHISINRDISERKRTEEELRRSELMYHTILEAVPDTAYLLDRDRRYTGVKISESAAPVHPPEFFMGKRVQDVLPSDLSALLLRTIDTALSTGQIQTVEYTRERDGMTIEREARIVPTDSGESIVFIRDLTAQRQLQREEARRRRVEELEGKVERQMLRRNPYHLTFRELTVLSLVASGMSDKEIAENLALSTFTVNKHVANILAKMQAPSRTQAATRAQREGLVE